MSNEVGHKQSRRWGTHTVKRHPNLDPEEVNQNGLANAMEPLQIIPYTIDFNADVRREAYTRLVPFDCGYADRVQLVKYFVVEPEKKVRQHIVDNLFEKWYNLSEFDLMQFIEPFNVVANGKVLENFFRIYIGEVRDMNMFDKLVDNFRNRISDLYKDNMLENVLCSNPQLSFVWFVLAKYDSRKHLRNVVPQQKRIEMRNKFWLNELGGLSISVATFHGLIRASLDNPPYVAERRNRDDPDTNQTKARKQSIFDSLVRLGCYIGLNHDDWLTLDPFMHNRPLRITGTFEPVFSADEKYHTFLENSESIFKLFAAVMGRNEPVLFELFDRLAKKSIGNRDINNLTESDTIRLLLVFIGYFSLTNYRVPQMEQHFFELIVTLGAFDNPTIATLKIKALARYCRNSAVMVQSKLLYFILPTLVPNSGTVLLEELIDILCRYEPNSITLARYLTFSEENYHKPLRELGLYDPDLYGNYQWCAANLKIRETCNNGLDNFFRKIIEIKFRENGPMAIMGILIRMCCSSGRFQVALDGILPVLVEYNFNNLNPPPLCNTGKALLKYYFINYASTTVLTGFIDKIYDFAKEEEFLDMIPDMLDYAYTSSDYEHRIELVNEMIESLYRYNIRNTIMVDYARAILEYIYRLNYSRIHWSILWHWERQLKAYLAEYNVRCPPLWMGGYHIEFRRDVVPTVCSDLDEAAYQQRRNERIDEQD